MAGNANNSHADIDRGLGDPTAGGFTPDRSATLFYPRGEPRVMTAPNRNTLWGRTIAEELTRAGVSAVCISPGSRSTPLTVAMAEHDDLRVFSQLDERSAAYFALGRARRSGRPTPLVCTSGTAAANYHPAVIEASQARVPMVLFTADRPPELRDSGANQTIDQEKLYGDTVRWYKDLPEPEATDRKLRSLRTDVNRAIAAACGTPAGPVHLNVPFRKPLEPTPVDGDVPEGLSRSATDGRNRSDASTPQMGEDTPPYVRTAHGSMEPTETTLQQIARALSVDRPLIVAGPADPPGIDADAVVALSHAIGAPILADPLSGLRFGGHTRVAPVVGGYDAYVNADCTDGWPDPEAVVRIGASPTSKALRSYLAGTDARQIVVDPAGGWREAEFAASDLVVADPDRFCRRLARTVSSGGTAPREHSHTAAWRDRWTAADSAHWEIVDREDATFEGGVLRRIVDRLPDPSTLVVSNSMPVRDLDRFGRPSETSVTAIGNRGASGIDGVVSTALGAATATTDRVTLVIGDLALYHDMNGLLAIDRCGVDATIVLLNNDGGGIFHMLPIESYDPPFTEQFKTPHGLDFEPTAELYGLEFHHVETIDGLVAAYDRSVESPGSDVIEVVVDAEASHRRREALQEATIEAVGTAIE